MPTKEILEELYQRQQLSITKIAVQLHISKMLLRKLFDSYSIPVRSKSDESLLQHNKVFKIKTDRSPQDEFLYGLGLGIYWGEGNKVDKYSIRVGNTDANLILTFVRFLENICGVQKADIKYGLQVFRDSDPDRALEYWLDKLACTRDAFHPTIITIGPQGKGSYKRKSEYGVIQVYVSNIRLKEWLMSEIKNCAEVAQW